MNEPFAFDAQLREVLAAGPLVAPASLVDGAFESARQKTQRRPRISWLDHRAWPAPRTSIADPVVARSLRVVLVLALLAAAAAASIVIGAALREEGREWRLQDAGSLLVIKNDPIAVGLPDGRLLVGGWGSGDGRLVEVFDPATGDSMAVGESDQSLSLQSATLLPDGRVLLIVWQHAEPVSDGRSFGRIFDPSINTLGAPIEMVEDRMQPGVSALADGRVLVTGGSTNPESGLVLDTVERFDPGTSTFAPAGRMENGRGGHAAGPLTDGRILITGGSTAVPRLVPGASGPALAAEATTTNVVIFDPETGSETVVGQVPSLRPPSPILLADGRALLFGREEVRCGEHGNRPLPTYLLDPAAGSLVRVRDVPHTPAIGVGLPDGRAFVAGRWQAIPGGCSGGGGYILDGWIGIYDPVSGAFVQTPDPITGAAGLPFDTDRNYRASVLLADGRVALVDEDYETAAPNAIDIVVPPR